jgi:cytochrome c
MNSVGKKPVAVSILWAALALSSDSAMAQDIDSGRLVFAQCSICHSVDGSNGSGPSLRGVVGRRAGSLPGFRYSKAMRQADIEWDAVSLDAYLADPQQEIPGNVMPFSGVPDARQRADLVAYLWTLK